MSYKDLLNLQNIARLGGGLDHDAQPSTRFPNGPLSFWRLGIAFFSFCILVALLFRAMS